MHSNRKVCRLVSVDDEVAEAPERRVWLRIGASWGARVVLYVVVTGIALTWAFYAGIAHYDARHCSGPDQSFGDCDLGDFEGAEWALITLCVLVVVIIAFEMGLRWLRRSRL